MQVKKQQLELDMEQQTGSKQEKEYIKAVYCPHAYLTYMQSTSWEMLGWNKHIKLEYKKYHKQPSERLQRNLTFYIAKQMQLIIYTFSK